MTLLGQNMKHNLRVGLFVKLRKNIAREWRKQNLKIF